MTDQEQAVAGCCRTPRLHWVPWPHLPEPIITCSNCGFRLDPDGILLDWLDPEAIEANRILEENTPYILELAARIGLIKTERIESMRTSKKMQRIITKIADKHGLDLAAEAARLRLDMPSFDRLVIEKVGKHLVSVAHYFEQEGDLIADPEIVFFTGYEGWVPIEVTQVIGGTRGYAGLTPDGQDIAWFNPDPQADLADFAGTWADNIKAQGWLENGVKWTAPIDLGELKPPAMEMLAAWLDEGGCEAACVHGCWVEPDGHCPHGKPSWLLKLGLI